MDHIAMLGIMTDIGWCVSTEISVARMLIQAGRTVKMEALHSFETLVRVYITQPYNVGGYEGWNFNSGNYLFTTDTK